MGFKAGIVGLPNVGKSTLFNALADFHPDERPAVDALIKACVEALPFLVAGTSDERYQTEVMRLAPAPKADPRKPPPDLAG